MPFPNISSAFETFLDPSRIHLFGKPFPTLQYDPGPMAGVGPGINPAQKEFETQTVTPAGGGNPPEAPVPPGRVEQALRKVDDGIFARIYGFSFEGHYYKLPRPLLFLVDDRTRRAEDNPPTAQFSARFTGIEGKDWQFGGDISVWAVDRHDIAICLDLEVGTYDRVLLQATIAGEEEAVARGTSVSTRSSAASRSSVSGRSSASFRSSVIGAHRDR